MYVVIACVIVVVVFALTSRYLKQETSSHEQKRRRELLAKTIFVLSCLFLGGVFWLEIHLAAIDLIRANWAVFKNTRLPRDNRRKSHEDLKKDGAFTKKALGKEYETYELAAADFEQEEFLLESAKSLLKDHGVYLRETTEILKAYQSLEPASKAYRDGKRTAPAGEFELTVEMHNKAAEYTHERFMLYLKTCLECVRIDQREKRGETEVLHFKGLQQDYAENRAAEFRKLGVSATAHKP